MAQFDHDLGPEGPSTARTRPVAAQRTPAGSSGAPLLDLQRLAGNAAVSQAVQSGRFDSSLPVQRLATELDENESEDIEAQGAAGLDEEEQEQVAAAEEELAETEEEEELLQA